MENELQKILRECIYALEYAAFNLDGTISEDVSDDIIESTPPSKTAIIAARNAKNHLKNL